MFNIIQQGLEKLWQQFSSHYHLHHLLRYWGSRARFITADIVEFGADVLSLTNIFLLRV